jgi:hypothetical protein
MQIHDQKVFFLNDQMMLYKHTASKIVILGPAVGIISENLRPFKGIVS